MDPSAYGPLDVGLTTAVLRALHDARTPEIAGVRPRDVESVDIAGSTRLRTAVNRAGYRDAAALADARLGDLAGRSTSLQVRDLDALHAATVRAGYVGLAMDAGLLEHVVEQRIPVDALLGLTSLSPDLEGALGELLQGGDLQRLTDLRHRGDQGANLPERNGYAWPPGAPTTRGDVVVLDELARVRHVGERRVPRGLDGLVSMGEDLLSEPLVEDVGGTLAVANRLLAAGEASAALRLAEKVARTPRAGLSGTERYQVEVLAGAVGTQAAAMLGATDRQVAAARRVMSGVVAGTDAHTTAVRSVVRLAAYEGDVARARAHRLAGPVGRTAEATAGLRYLEAVTGAALGKDAAKSGLLLEGQAALLDLHRAFTATIGAAAGDDTIVAPKDPGVDGRDLSEETGAWLLSMGGVSSLADPIIKAQVLQSWRHLRELHGATTSVLPVTLPGDLFRFDFLLDEARRLGDDIGRIEDLIASFMHMLVDLDIADVTGRRVAASQITQEIERIVSQLEARVAAIRDALPGIVNDLVTALRDASLTLGVLRALAMWPHDRWIKIVVAFIGAVSGGRNPVNAVMDEIDSWVRGEIGRLVRDVTKDVNARLKTLQNRVDAIAVPKDLEEELDTVLGLAGINKTAASYLQPLHKAIADIRLEKMATTALTALSALNSGPIPGWVRALLVAYVAAPLVTAFAVYLASGPLGWIALAALIALGGQYIVSVVLRALDGALQRALGVTAAVDAAMGQLEEMVGALLNVLADVGSLMGLMKAAADAIALLRKALDGIIRPEVRLALQDVLVGAKSVVLDHLRGVMGALERSFFRETLELVEVPPDLFSNSLPIGRTIAGFSDPSIGSSAKVASALSAFEAQRVVRGGVLQEVTQVLSLRHLLGSDVPLQALLSGDPLPFDLLLPMLDRVAPGMHRALIKDVQVHVDFAVPAKAQGVLDGVLGSAALLAGGAIDPALDGRVPGGGFPGLPVVAGRVPTGLPAVLTHTGRSLVRLKPSRKLTAAYAGRKSAFSAVQRRGPLRGTRLLADADAEANERGWRLLELIDPPASLLLSHFDVLADGVRFIRPDKQLKPFEHRGLIGGWTLEIPALALGSVAHQLPPIRDVRLVVSTVAAYDRGLATLVAQPPLPAVAEPALIPSPNGSQPLPFDLDDLTGQLKDVLEGLLAELLGTTTADLGSALSQMLADFGAALDGLQVQVTSGADALGRDLAAMSALTQALTAALVAELTRVTGVDGATGTQVQGLVLSTADLAAGTVSGLLAGGSGTWTVTASTLQAHGIDPAAVQRVLGAIVSPLLSTALGGGLGAVTGFPATDSALALGSQAASFRLGQTPALIDGESLTSAPPLQDPTGTWTLTLPSGLPPGVTGVLALVLVEVALP
jgi:hypothetical protein